MRAFLTVIILFSAGLAGSVAVASSTPDPLFQDEKTLKVKITGPLYTLVKKRPRDEYLPGVFSFTDTDGTAVDLDVGLRARGHFRHKNCDFPPVGLNFKKSQTAGTLFDKQNKMKLVVHCDDSARYEQTVLREYLAYKLLNSLSDESFRARLLQVTYVDTEGRRDQMVRYAFLIEHKDRLAKRLNRKVLEIERARLSAIQGDHLNLTSVFQFMLGNTDFSPLAGANNECCHNYVLFDNKTDPLLAIPYDFDQSGFVNAPYAEPNERLGIKSVRQRVYRGRCANNKYIPGSISQFKAGRDEILALIAEQEGMDSGVRKDLTRYVNDFYKIIDKPRSTERKIVDKCL